MWAEKFIHRWDHRIHTPIPSAAWEIGEFTERGSRCRCEGKKAVSGQPMLNGEARRGRA